MPIGGKRGKRLGWRGKLQLLYCFELKESKNFEKNLSLEREQIVIQFRLNRL